jgi:ATP synthase protein I
MSPLEKEDENDRSLQSETVKMYKVYMKTSAVGLEVCISVVLGLGGGYLVDSKWGTGPWGIIAGVVLGSLAAVRALFRFSKQYLKEEHQDDSDSRH